MARDSFQFSVWGLQPRPQGSKKYVGMRRTAAGNNIPLIIESSNQLPQWRKAIEQAILQGVVAIVTGKQRNIIDRKSTRLNSSHRL